MAMAEEAAASIAHEIRQPLVAMIANANASVRWLGRTPPDLGEARAALTNIVAVGHQTGEVIEAIQAIFKRKDQQRIGAGRQQAHFRRTESPRPRAASSSNQRAERVVR